MTDKEKLAAIQTEILKLGNASFTECDLNIREILTGQRPTAEELEMAKENSGALRTLTFEELEILSGS